MKKDKADLTNKADKPSKLIIKTNFFEVIPQGTKIDFMGMAWYMIIITTALSVISLGLVFYLGFNWSIDFVGGLEMRVEFKNQAKNATIHDVRRAMTTLPADLPLTDVQVTNFIVQNKNVYSIKAKGEENVTRAGGDQALHDLSGKVFNYLAQKFGKENVEVISVDMVGPRVGASLRRQGIYSIFYSLLGILLYMGYRFNYRFSPGAVVCLMHDLAIVAGVYAVLRLEVDLTVIAAFLTIAGYDVNDTIVVFDRIREGRNQKYRTLPVREMVNRAINETLSRTVLTSGVTMLVVIALLFLGGQILFNFALAMTMGIVLGTYSSIFIASPLYVFLEELYVKRRKARGAKA